MDTEQVYAVRTKENGDLEYMQDVIMCAILGADRLPDGFEVGFLDGDTLNNQRANLVLQPIGSGRNAVATKRTIL